MESTLVRIAGIDKVTLLRELCKLQPPSEDRVCCPLFDAESAKEAVARGRIDYFQDRHIDADLRGDWVDASSYDRRAGSGSFFRAACAARYVSELSEKKWQPSRKMVCPKTRREGDRRESCFESAGGPMRSADPGSVLCCNCLQILKRHSAA